jgi:serine/threonine protein kinase/tetratricopeptide (TPR) repeat protein
MVSLLKSPLKLETGSQIASYSILGPLGSGGMGEVYRARDLNLDREVALKILSPDMAGKDNLRRFEQEARAASALNHPNIITIYEIGHQGDVSYIAMEIVHGGSLRDLMNLGQVPLAEGLRIASKVADGLAAAHERGIVHRDLKPENLMISRDGFVKVLDFGLAKLTMPTRADGPTVPQTTAGVVMGTVSYMSPEQARGRPVDCRSDQFSLGIILYEMLTGRRPFDRDSIGDTMAAIIRDEPASIKSSNTDVPADLITIIENCLAKDRDDRYQSTRELARELRDVRDGLATGTGPGATTHRLKPSHHVKRKMPLAVIASIVAGLALLGVGGVFLARRDSAPAVPIGPKSVAIVPFRDASGTAQGQIFSDGISQTIGARLAEAPTLKIFTPFDGAGVPKNADPAAVVKHTGAKLMLTGIVQHAGQELRVTYSLIELEAGAQIASRTVNGSIGDIFTLEDNVADGILRTLGATPPRKSHAEESGLTRPADQQTFTEAIGLLQKSRDAAAIEQAIGKLEAILPNARDSAEVNAELARAYYIEYSMTRRQALLDQARLYAERAIQIDPRNGRAHAILGSVRRDSGDYTGAISELKLARDLAPNDSAGMVGLGETYSRMGRAADADRAFQQAIELHPDSWNGFNIYGIFCLHRGQYERAAKLFQRVTVLLPESSRGFTNLGATYQSAGRYQEALQAYQRAVKIGPTMAAYSGLGGCQFALGHYSDACRAYEKETELAPNSYIAWSNLGDAYRWTPPERDKAAGAYAKAVTAAQASLHGNPKDAYAHAIIAISFGKTGQVNGAGKEIDAALKLDPSNADVLYQAAVLAAISRDSDKALLLVGRAVAAGYPTASLTRDPELTPIRDEPAFRQAISAPKPKS